MDTLAQLLRGPGTATWRLAEGLRQFAARAWNSRRLAFALIAEPVDQEVDEQRLLYRESYAELFIELLEEGRASGEFDLLSTPLTAACLVGAIAEALVGPLSPPARAAREPGRPRPTSTWSAATSSSSACAPWRHLPRRIAMNLHQFAETHDVLNQVPSLDGANLASTCRCRSGPYDGGWAEAQLDRYGAAAGALMAAGFLANEQAGVQEP